MNPKLATALKYHDLPTGLNAKALDRQRRERLFTYITKPLIDGLVNVFQGKNVLEVYAGRGHMSALLHEKGIDIRSTSLRQGHDASEQLGHVFDVEDIDAASAVEKYKDWMDALLVCWPTTDMGMFNVLRKIPKDIPIIFIGEVTDYSISPPFFGGCACDDFFANVVENSELKGLINYESFGQSQLKIYNRKAKIERVMEYGLGF